MTDEINPGCTQRFAGIEGDVSEMKASLDSHAATLSEHTGILKQHEALLKELQAGQKSLSDVVTSSQMLLVTMQAAVDTVKTELARINGWQTKLIFVLVGALIILAGVQKLGDLGIL
jgi:hypothetical protein